MTLMPQRWVGGEGGEEIHLEAALLAAHTAASPARKVSPGKSELLGHREGNFAECKTEERQKRQKQQLLKLRKMEKCTHCKQKCVGTFSGKVVPCKVGMLKRQLLKLIYKNVIL